MLKIMIVDDEPLLRMALKNLVDWEANGFRMLPDASNGDNAIDLIKTEAPNILLTDIKMPGMNGVELIKYLQDNYPQVKTVVLSNYDDFSYVKEALLHGAADYILKANITPEKLINTINVLKDKFILDEYQEKESLKRENEVKRNFDWLRNEFLKNLVIGKISTFEEIQFYNNYYETGMKEGKYIVCTLIADEWAELNGKYSGEEIHILQNTINTILGEVIQFDKIFFPYNINHYVLVIYMDCFSENSFISSIYEALSRFQTAVLRYTNISFTVGISGIKEKLQEIHIAHKESIQAAVYKFYKGSGKIYKLGDITLKDEDPGVKWINKENIRAIKDSLERGKMDCIDKILEECFADIEQNQYDITLVKQFFTDFIIFIRNSLIEHAEKYEADIERVEKISNQFNMCETYSEAKNTLLMYTAGIESSLNKWNTMQYSEIVSKAVQNISANYDKNLTLNSVADSINVNSSYLSRLFLKETGQNFIDYLTDIKVKKAMSFLIGSNLSVQEVGEKVGYQNPKYFNRVFKKLAGVSPNQYRKTNRT